MIKKISNLEQSFNLVYIISAEGKVSESLKVDGQFVSHFQQYKKKVDFIKTENGYTFFVKKQDDLEDMRLAGFEIRKQLDLKEKQLTLVGEGESVLALAEGFMLTNYQFLK